MLRLLAIAAALASMAVAGCNETGAGPATTVATTDAVGSRLPPGAPCSGEINRYQAVVKSDLDTGNLEEKVYRQIQDELNRAMNACVAGRGGEAHAIVAASKAKHGYRA